MTRCDGTRRVFARGTTPPMTPAPNPAGQPHAHAGVFVCQAGDPSLVSNSGGHAISRFSLTRKVEGSHMLNSIRQIMPLVTVCPPLHRPQLHQALECKKAAQAAGVQGPLRVFPCENILANGASCSISSMRRRFGDQPGREHDNPANRIQQRDERRWRGICPIRHCC